MKYCLGCIEINRIFFHILIMHKVARSHCNKFAIQVCTLESDLLTFAAGSPLRFPVHRISLYDFECAGNENVFQTKLLSTLLCNEFETLSTLISIYRHFIPKTKNDINKKRIFKSKYFLKF